MADGSANGRTPAGVLERMLRGGVGDGMTAAAATGRMTPARALGLAFARAGETELETEVSITEAGLARMRPEALQPMLPDPGLILALRGDDGRLGLAALCPQLVAAVVEAQTMGTVQPGAAPERRATSTDGAMAAALIEAGLTIAATLAGELPEAAFFAGLACGPMRPDPRSAVLGLRDRDHHVWTLAAEAGGGAKAGTLLLALPEPLTAAAPGPGDPASFGRGLRRAVLDSSAQLDAVLARLVLPLAQVRLLAPGQVIPLTGARLAEVELCGADGHAVARVRLGRSGERKAVRLGPGGAAAFERAATTGAPPDGPAPPPGQPAADAEDAQG